jgi:hypothetical protein
VQEPIPIRDLPAREPSEAASGTTGVALLAGAAAGLAVESIKMAAAVGGAVNRTLVRPSVSAAAAVVERTPGLRDVLEQWRSSWERERTHGATIASDAWGRFVRQVTEAVLDQLDVTALVLEHVDVERLVQEVDADALAGDIDVNALAGRVEMDRLAARIDVDALAARLDLDAVIDRVDVVAIARDVIEELDLAQLVREAASETTSEGVRSVRLRGVDADRAVRRAVDRLLARKAEG